VKKEVPDEIEERSVPAGSHVLAQLLAMSDWPHRKAKRVD
jgi:hypothetical protein